MPQLTFDFPGRLVKVFTQAVGTFLLVATFFIIQYVFHLEFVCYCRPGRYVNTVLYVILPPVVLAWLINITEPIHKRRVFFRWCFQRRNVHCSCFWKCTLDYIGLCAVWSAAVLFDGDWLVCLLTNLNTDQTGIPCKKTLTDREEQIKAEYKTASLTYGLIIICVFVVFWSCGEWIYFCCSSKKEWNESSCEKHCKGCCSGPERHPYYKVVYEDVLQEEVRQHLKKKVSEIAKKRAEAICSQHITDIERAELKVNNREERNNGDTRVGEQGNNGGEGNDGDREVLDAWWRISASDFYTTIQTHDNPKRERPGGSSRPEEGSPDELIPLGKVTPEEHHQDSFV